MSKIALEGNASGTGTLTIASQNTNSNYTLTLPNSTGTLVVTGGAQTIEFAAGSAASPSITFTGDTNTGIFSPGADTIAFSEGGTESMRIDSSGNVGIGSTTPNSYGRLQVKQPGTTFSSGLTVTTQADDSSLFIYDSGSSWNFLASYLSTGSYKPIVFNTGNAERMRIDSSGNVGIGTSSPSVKLGLEGTAGTGDFGNGVLLNLSGGTISAVDTGVGISFTRSGSQMAYIQARRESASNEAAYLAFATQTSGGLHPERARITSAGRFLIGTTPGTFWGTDVQLQVVGNAAGDYAAGFRNAGNNTNRLGIAIAAGTDDSSGTSTLVGFTDGDGNQVGTITNAGGTVSYNAFLGSHYTEVQGETIALLGTVYESVDALVENQYSSQDRLPKVKISDTVESTSVYGVYLGDSDWNTEAQGPTGILVAAVGAGWVRIAQGVTVQKGDLLVSNGDGCAKVQSDDIVRSKTIGKVVSTTVVDTYPDGSYLVPVVLYCG